MCQGAGCNDPMQVNLPEQVPGADGASAYVYIASADSNTGTNFTYPQDETQPYVAIITRSTPIVTPVQTDFTGEWRRVAGIPGTNGTSGTNGVDGISSGILYNLLNYGSFGGDPGTGNISFSGGNLSLTSLIYINETNLSSVDVSALLSAVGTTSTSAVKGIIKITKKGDETKFAVFSINSVTDGGAYQTLNVNYLSATAPNTFTAGDDLYIEFYLTGQKGDQGLPGATGAFIVGTFGSSGTSESYRATASYGSAYRATQNGTISDNGANLTNVRRFFTNDILYCIADSTSSDGTKWILWQGFPRPFYPGAGTDSFILNTSLGGTATGARSISSRGTTVSGDDSTSFGRNGTISGTDSFNVGVSNVSASDRTFTSGNGNTIGTGCPDAMVIGNTNNLGNGSEAAAIVGRQNTVGTNSTSSLIEGDFHLVANNLPYVKTAGTGASILIANSETIGAGTWATGSNKGRKQIMRFPLSQDVLGSSATSVLSTITGSGTSVFTLPTKSCWLVKARVQSVISSGGNIGALSIWDVSFQVTNIAGTAALKGNIICQIDDGTTTIISALNTALDKRITDVANGSIFKITGSGATISFAVIGAAGAGDPTLWSAEVEVVQLGWF